MLKHRNSQKRIYFKDACYLISCKTEGNVPFFRERIFGDLFVENLRLCKRLKGFLLFGWVLIYDHFHLQIMPNDKWNISDVMHFLKRNFSRDINWILDYNRYDHKPIEGADHDPRLLQVGMYQYLQPIINEHDYCIKQLKIQFQQKFSNKHPFIKFQWQKSFHDHYIRNDRDFDYHMEYIAYNPIKHKMPNDWSYVYTNPEYEDLIDE